MIAGNISDHFLNDFRYNASEEDLFRLVSVKKALASEVGRLKKDKTKREELYKTHNLLSHLEDTILPSLYNQLKGHDQQSAFSKCTWGNHTDESLKNIAEFSDYLATSAKYEEGTMMEKLTKVLYNEYKNVPVEISEEDVEEQRKQMQQFGQSSGSGPKSNKEDEGMKDMTGYKKLAEWLSSLKESMANKKKYREISKMSDLQKVSATEFVRPKSLFMKKLINKELYCKQKTVTKRVMHTIIDFSPSMGSYHTMRDHLVTKMYKDCTKYNIDFENTFWDDILRKCEKYGPNKIESETDLIEKVLSVRPGGSGTNMPHSTIEKLNLMKNIGTKQYLLVISDGDGEIDDSNQSQEIYKLCKEKNVDIKFALFNRSASMATIKPEDIFYIYDDKGKYDNDRKKYKNYEHSSPEEDASQKELEDFLKSFKTNDSDNPDPTGRLLKPIGDLGAPGINFYNFNQTNFEQYPFEKVSDDSNSVFKWNGGEFHNESQLKNIIN